MRKLAIIILTAFPAIAYSQYNYGFLQTAFFGRQPSARAEAMGRAYSSIDGDLTSIFYNPAGIASIIGLEFDASFSSPYYLLDEAKYNFLSAGYKFNEYLIIGLSRNRFAFGEITIVDEIGNSFGTYKPKNTAYTFTLASQPIKNLYIGLNTNYFTMQVTDEATSVFWFDFGIIKKFELLQNDDLGHSLNIGASISNFNNTKAAIQYTGKTFKEELPVITRYGANYQFTFYKNRLIERLNPFGLLLQGEYIMLLNSEYHTGIQLGAEISILEIASIRVGYYKEKIDDFGNPHNLNEITSFTYGFGLNLPIEKLTRIPLHFCFDYTSLPQVAYTLNINNLDNFKAYNLRLIWVFRNNN